MVHRFRLFSLFLRRVVFFSFRFSVAVLFLCLFVCMVLLSFFRGQDIYHYLLCWHKHHSLHSMLHFTNHQRRESYAYCRLLAIAKTCKWKRNSNTCKKIFQNSSNFNFQNDCMILRQDHMFSSIGFSNKNQQLIYLHWWH